LPKEYGVLNMKTLLRYPGGKAKAVKKIIEYFPKDLTEMNSVFFGGGAIELHMMSEGVKVNGYDNFSQLVTFWDMVSNETAKQCVIDEIKKYRVGTIDKKTFKKLQTDLIYNDLTNIEVASKFFIVNRCSFSGTTLSGGMSPNTPRYTESSVNKLKAFDGSLLDITKADFEDSLTFFIGKNDFKYCDPPYLIESNLYGIKGKSHKEFDHDLFANCIKKHSNWIISYNDCDWVRESYKEYEIKELKFQYGTSKSKTELLILNIRRKHD